MHHRTHSHRLLRLRWFGIKGMFQREPGEQRNNHLLEVSSNIAQQWRLIRLGTRLKVKLVSSPLLRLRCCLFCALQPNVPLRSISLLFFAFLFASHVPFSSCRNKERKLRDISLHNNKKFMMEIIRSRQQVYHCIVMGIMNFIMNDNVTRVKSQRTPGGGGGERSRKINVAIASDDSIIGLHSKEEKKLINKHSRRASVNGRMKMCDK